MARQPQADLDQAELVVVRREESQQLPGRIGALGVLVDHVHMSLGLGDGRLQLREHAGAIFKALFRDILEQPGTVDQYRQPFGGEHLDSGQVERLHGQRDRRDLVDVGQIGDLLHGLDRGRLAMLGFIVWRIGVAAVRVDHHIAGKEPGWPEDTPLLDIIGVEARIAWMPASVVESQFAGDIDELVPCPGFGRIGRRRLDPGLLQHIGVVVQVVDHPAGSDPIPPPVDRCALLLLGLDEVIRLADHRVALDAVGDIHHHAARHIVGHVAGPEDIGRGAAGQHGFQLGLVFLVGRMQPGDGDPWVALLEEIEPFLDVLLFQQAAPAHHRDRHGSRAALWGGAGGSSRRAAGWRGWALPTSSQGTQPGGAQADAASTQQERTAGEPGSA